MILKDLDAPDEFTDVSQWHFVFTTPKEINSYYDSLNLKGKLDSNAGTPMVYIVDKARSFAW
jgi:hypothetical protein